MDAHAIGRRIAYWRDRRRLTQQDLGHLMGRNRRGIQDLERGERQADPRVSVMEDAARALRIPSHGCSRTARRPPVSTPWSWRRSGRRSSGTT